MLKKISKLASNIILKEEEKSKNVDQDTYFEYIIQSREILND